MDDARDVDVNHVTDTLPVRRITYLVLALCFGAMLAEGYNLGVPGLAAPGLIKSFSVTRAELAPVFSAALFGSLWAPWSAAIGATGRAQARHCAQHGDHLRCKLRLRRGAECERAFLAALRGGHGAGWLLPNGAALMAELIPRKVRATFTTYAFMGIIAGGRFRDSSALRLADGVCCSA